MNKDFEEKVEQRFINELRKYYSDSDIDKYWAVKFSEFNPAFHGCSLQVRYLETGFNDSCVDLEIWEKRMSNDNYTFKFIIEAIVYNELDKMKKIIEKIKS